MKNLPWSDAQETLLLQLVLAANAHLVTGMAATAKWYEINEAFFNHAQLAAYKDDHYNPLSFRKIRDKYDTLIKRVQENNRAGKITKRSDEVVTLATQIIDVLEETKSRIEEESAKKRRKFNATIGSSHSNIIDTSTTNACIGVENVSTSASSSAPVIPITTSPIIVPQSTPLVSFVAPSIDIYDMSKVKLNNWIKTDMKTIESLIEEAEISEVDTSRLRELGLRVLVSLYCDRHKKFEPAPFKAELQQEGVSGVNSLKVWATLDLWRANVMCQ